MMAVRGRGLGKLELLLVAPEQDGLLLLLWGALGRTPTHTRTVGCCGVQDGSKGVHSLRTGCQQTSRCVLADVFARAVGRA